jgi:hypothetical protein
VNGVLGLAQLLAHLLESRRIGIVTVDVAQDTHQLLETFRIQATVMFHAVFGALFQLVEVPAGFGDPNDWDIELSTLGQLLQAGKTFLCARSPMAPKNTKASDTIALNGHLIRQAAGCLPGNCAGLTPTRWCPAVWTSHRRPRGSRL